VRNLLFYHQDCPINGTKAFLEYQRENTLSTLLMFRLPSHVRAHVASRNIIPSSNPRHLKPPSSLHKFLQLSFSTHPARPIRQSPVRADRNRHDPPSQSSQHAPNMSSQSADLPRHPMSKYLRESQSKIFANNKAWVASKVAADPTFFKKLASGQQPDYLYVFLPSSIPVPPYHMTKSNYSLITTSRKGIISQVNRILDTSAAPTPASQPTKSWVWTPAKSSCTGTSRT
jgi:hypothetical protein